MSDDASRDDLRELMEGTNEDWAELQESLDKSSLPPTDELVEGFIYLTHIMEDANIDLQRIIREKQEARIDVPNTLILFVENEYLTALATSVGCAYLKLLIADKTLSEQKS